MTFLRRPLLYWFVFAAAAALTAGGRLSIRLLFDTAIVLAPVVVIQVAAITATYWTGPRPLPYAWAVDEFFAGSRAWFVALTLQAAFTAFSSPPEIHRWFALLNLVLFAIAIILSMRTDFRFYRSALGRATRRAVMDVAGQRAVAWTATVFYFLFTAAEKSGKIWHDVAERLVSPWQ